MIFCIVSIAEDRSKNRKPVENTNLAQAVLGIAKKRSTFFIPISISVGQKRGKPQKILMVSKAGVNPVEAKTSDLMQMAYYAVRCRLCLTKKIAFEPFFIEGSFVTRI